MYKKMAVAVLLSFGLGFATHAIAEPQPQMRKALVALQSAVAHLKAASADKGGHRVKAIALAEQAIEEVKLGIDYDNKH